MAAVSRKRALHELRAAGQPAQQQEDPCCGGGGVTINQRTGQPIRVACLPCHRARTSCDRDALAAEAGDGSRPPCSRCVRLGRESKCVDRPPRKTTKVACVHCIRAKRSCGEQRPCKRCVSRGMAHQCVDRDAPAPAPTPKAVPPTHPVVGSAAAAAAAAAVFSRKTAVHPDQPQPAGQPAAVAQAQARAAAAMAAAQAAVAAEGPPVQHRPKRQRLLSFEGPAAPFGSLDLSATPMLSFPVLLPGNTVLTSAPSQEAAQQQHQQHQQHQRRALAQQHQQRHYQQQQQLLQAMPPQPQVPRALPFNAPSASALPSPKLAEDPLFTAVRPLRATSIEDDNPHLQLPATSPDMMRLDSGERAMINAADSIDTKHSSINDDLDGWVAMFGGPSDAGSSSVGSSASSVSPPRSPSTSSDADSSSLSPSSPSSSRYY